MTEMKKKEKFLGEVLGLGQMQCWISLSEVEVNCIIITMKNKCFFLPKVFGKLPVPPSLL